MQQPTDRTEFIKLFVFGLIWNKRDVMSRLNRRSRVRRTHFLVLKSPDAGRWLRFLVDV